MAQVVVSSLILVIASMLVRDIRDFMERSSDLLDVAFVGRSLLALTLILTIYGLLRVWDIGPDLVQYLLY